MTRTAEVEGLGAIEFDDDTPDDVIERTVQQLLAGHEPGPPPGLETSGHGPIGKRPAHPETYDEANARARIKYANKSGLDVALEDLKMARDDVMGGVNAFNRASAQALGSTVLPLGDAATGLINLLQPRPKPTVRQLITGEQPQDNSFKLPSQEFETLLNKYTQAPETPAGRVAEMVNSAILGRKLPMIPGLTMPTAPPTSPNPRINPAPEEIIEQGRKHQVPVFYPDVSQNPLVKKVDIFAESLPSELGTAAGRADQNAAAIDAAKRVVAQQAPEAGKDVETLLQKSMQKKLKLLKDIKTRLYRRASDELDPHGVVGTPRLNQAFQEVRAALKEQPFSKNKEVAKTIDELYKYGQQGNFSREAALSDELGKRIDDFYNGADTTLGSSGVQHLVKLKEAVDADIATFANNVNSSTGKQAYKVADDFYQQFMVPYRAEGFNKLVRTQEPEKIWTYLTSQGGVPSRAARMYQSLDAEGRQTVRYGLVKEAFDNAMGPKGVFSPAKFSGYLEKNEELVNRFFKGRELDEIHGFRKLMRHVDRSGQFMENPANGQRLLLPMLLGSGFYSKWIPTAYIGTGVGARLLFQTEKGRDMLMKLGRAAPDSKEAREMAGGAINFLLRAAMVQQQSQSPSALDFNDMIENAVGAGAADENATATP